MGSFLYLPSPSPHDRTSIGQPRQVLLETTLDLLFSFFFKSLFDRRFYLDLPIHCTSSALTLTVLLEPLCRWCRTLAHTPWITTSLLQPLARTHIQFAVQLCRGFFSVYEVAEAATHAALATVQPTARFPEIGHGGQLAVDRAPSVPSRVEGITGLLRVFFVFESYVDVADKICLSFVNIHIFSGNVDRC